MSSEKKNSFSGLSFLFSPNSILQGDPNKYEITAKILSNVAIEKSARGDLSSSIELITIHDIPVGEQVEVTASLFKDEFSAEKRTHYCFTPNHQPVEIDSSEIKSVSLVCVPLKNGPGVGNDPVAVFFKVVDLEIILQETSLSDGLDLERPKTYANLDPFGRRISLKVQNGRMSFSWGGESQYFSEERGSGLLEKLLVQGQEIHFKPFFGRYLPILQSRGILKNTAAKAFYFFDSKKGRLAVPFSFSTEDGRLNLNGVLIEQDGSSEFTVATYNTENFFDQKDDARNESYGDYRLKPNKDGYYSNYGEQVEYQGKMTNFTMIKAMGIRNVLTGIDPSGPEIVALQEVESEEALMVLFDLVKDLGYKEARFAGWSAPGRETAVSIALITKFPIIKSALIDVKDAENTPGEKSRPIQKIILDVNGKQLIIYNNHWKSKSGPESQRVASAKALQADLDRELAENSMADYMIVGDLNSDYNQDSVLEAELNDTNGQTGINSILKSQGDEQIMTVFAKRSKYDLLYEKPKEARRTVYSKKFGWSTFDHIILGNGLYDQKGISYVENSYTIPDKNNSSLAMIFDEDYTPKRWIAVRDGLYTRHEIGGYSDHFPVFARFFIAARQSTVPIKLIDPGLPDITGNK